jgi:hypothetical protein
MPDSRKLVKTTRAFIKVLYGNRNTPSKYSI